MAINKQKVASASAQDDSGPDFGTVTKDVNSDQALLGFTNLFASMFRKARSNVDTFKELTEEEIESEELNHRSAMMTTIVELLMGGIAVLMVFMLAPGALEFVQSQFVDGATRIICWVILGLFVIGMYFVFRTLTIINYEYANLMDIFKKSRKVAARSKSRIHFSELMPRAQYGVVFDKLDSVFRIARDNGSVPHEAMADILLTKHAMQDEIPSFLANAMTMIGLIGTIIGLTGATGGMETLFTSVGDLGKLKEGFQETLAGIDVAFFTTLFGAAGMLMLKYFNIVARKARVVFLTELEQVMLTEIIPKVPRLTFVDKEDGRRVSKQKTPVRKSVAQGARSRKKVVTRSASLKRSASVSSKK